MPDVSEPSQDAASSAARLLRRHLARIAINSDRQSAVESIQAYTKGAATENDKMAREWAICRTALNTDQAAEAASEPWPALLETALSIVLDNSSGVGLNSTGLLLLAVKAFDYAHEVGDETILQLCVTALREARSDPTLRNHVDFVLGKALIDIHKLTGSRELTSQAAALYGEYLSRDPRGEHSYELLNDASVAYLASARAFGSMTSLSLSLHLAEAALAAVPNAHEDYGYILSNLGVVYRQVHLLTNDDEYRAKALACYSEALSLETLPSNDRRVAAANFLNLGESNAELRELLVATIADDPHPSGRARRTNTIAAGLLTSADFSHNVALDVLDLLLTSLAEVRPTSRDAAMLLTNIATCSSRWRGTPLHGPSRDLQIAARRWAKDVAASSALDLMDVATAWVADARSAEDAEQYAMALALLNEATFLLLMRQTSDQDRLNWMQRLNSSLSEGVVALLDIGELSEAAALAESSKAMVLSQRLFLRGGLTATHRELPESVSTLRRQLEDMYRAPHESPFRREGDVVKLLTDLSLAQGHSPAELSTASLLPRHDPRESARYLDEGTCITYFVVGLHRAGAAIVLESDGAVHQVRLAALREDEVMARIWDHYSAYRSRRSDYPHWLNTFSSTSQWLGEDVLGPAMAELVSPQHVVCVPIGVTTYLPMHAASYRARGEHRYFLDELGISYAPNARIALRDGSGRPRFDGDGGVILTAANSDGWRNSPYAELEAKLVQRAFPEWRHQAGGEVNGKALLAACNSARFLHLTCHGVDAIVDADMAELVLGESRVDISMLAAHNFENLEIATLAACGAALPLSEHMDEAWGFPGVLLGAGAKAVVSAMWAVDDLASAALMAFTYHECSSNGRTPYQGMRFAQLGLKAGSLPANVLEQMPPLFQSRLERGVYRHPSYWAPFAYHGTL